MRRLVGVLAGVVLAAGSLVAVGVTPAGALTTITVTSNGDAGGACTPFPTNCTLRQAFEAARSGGSAAADDVVIVIQPGVGTITLGSTLAYDGGAGGTHALTIRGTGATVRGNDTFPLISNLSFGSLTIDDLTLTKGVGPNGGAIFSQNGPVTVSNSTFTDNQATSAGGAIYTNGPLTVTNSTFTNNQADEIGGAIFADLGVTVKSSTFADNRARGGGAIYAYGLVTATNSTISGNTATGIGGGIFVCADGSVVLVYATVVANSAPEGANIGGLCTCSTESTSGGDVSAENCGSPHSQADGATALSISDPLQSFGSVVALPLGGGTNCKYIFDDPVGYNFSDDTSCGLLAATDKQDAGDPLLGALASNGGPTLTRLPQAGSPLIDAIPNANCGDGNALAGFAVTTDQRHLARPEQTGGKCDIGAVEVQLPPAPVVIVPKFTG